MMDEQLKADLSIDSPDYDVLSTFLACCWPRLKQQKRQHEALFETCHQQRYQLEQLNAQLKQQTQDNLTIRKQYAELKKEYQQLQQNKQQTEAELLQQQQALEAAHSTLKQLEADRAKMESVLAEHEQEIAYAAEKLQQIEIRKKKTEDQLEKLKQELKLARETMEQAQADRARAENLLAEREHELQQWQEKFTQLEQSEAERRKILELVASVVSASGRREQNEHEFSRVLHDEEDGFLSFLNTVDVLEQEADVVIKLKAIEDQVRLLESLKRFKNKRIVAVSGGFSSGKSSLINQLCFDGQPELPVGIEPITAIPTYVFGAEEHKIMGYASEKGEFEIEEEIYQLLTHENTEKLGLSLHDLITFIALETPLLQHDFEHLAFIDLPGYNAGSRNLSDGVNYTSSDKDSAAEYMRQARCLLWVIGMDAQGTIPADDIDFLIKNRLDALELYIVVNKADIRPPSQIEEVLDEVEDMLEEADVEYKGISAYSSISGQELGYRHCSLQDVLAEWDKKNTETYRQLHDSLEQIFETYDKAFEADIAARENKQT